MSAEIIRNPTVLEMRTDPDGTPAVIDLCAYTTAVRIEGSQDEIDLSTYCADRTGLGNVRWSVVLAFLWEEALYDALEPALNQEVEMVLVPPLMASGGNAIVWRGRFGFLPFGNFEINSRVESELPMSVTVAPSKTTKPV